MCGVSLKVLSLSVVLAWSECLCQLAPPSIDEMEQIFPATLSRRSFGGDSSCRQIYQTMARLSRCSSVNLTFSITRKLVATWTVLTLFLFLLRRSSQLTRKHNQNKRLRTHGKKKQQKRSAALSSSLPFPFPVLRLVQASCWPAATSLLRANPTRFRSLQQSQALFSSPITEAKRGASAVISTSSKTPTTSQRSISVETSTTNFTALVLHLATQARSYPSNRRASCSSEISFTASDGSSPSALDS